MRTKRVLVIDDEADIRTVIRGCLEEIAHWDVVTAPSGQDGLHLAAIAQPDCILLDLSMPGMDGLEVLERLQADAATQAIPVVLLTAKTLADEQYQQIKSAIAGFIFKPFDPLLLVDQLTSIFQKYDSVSTTQQLDSD